MVRTIYFLLAYCICSLGQNSLSAQQNRIRDAVLVNYEHDLPTSIVSPPFSTPTESAFLPYIAYLSKENTILDSLLDGAILRDTWLGRGATRSGNAQNYEGHTLTAYLNDTFLRARMLFDSPDSFGSTGVSLHLSFEHFASHDRITFPSIPIGLGAKSPSRTVTFATYAKELSTSANLLFGIELFRENGSEITGVDGVPGLGGSLVWSDDHDFWISSHPLSSTWSQSYVTAVLPSHCHTAIPQIGRSGGEIVIDYCQLVDGEPLNLLTTSQLEAANFNTLIRDGGFEGLQTRNVWQRGIRPVSNRPRISLFSDQVCAMDAIAEGRRKLGLVQALDEPYKIVLMLHEPGDLSPQTVNHYISLVGSYIDDAVSRYQQWSGPNLDANIELAGFYLVKESIDGGASEWHDFLAWAQSDLESRGLALFCSPYWKGSSKTDPTPAIAEEYHSYFDTIWFQPVARDSGGVSSGNIDCDTDRLEAAAQYVRDNGLGINIERTGDLQENYAGYGRVLDYLDYGLKYGYVSTTKCYFDGRRFWSSAHSQDSAQREQYDELYEFSRRSRDGHIVNGLFEANEGADLFGWEGEYSIGYPPVNLHRAHQWMTQSPGEMAKSHFRVRIGPSGVLQVKFEIREPIQDSSTKSALIGIEFYDKNGAEVRSGSSNMNWSSSLNMWYRYIDPQATWQTIDWDLIAPGDSVSAKLYLRNWSSSAQIEWDNLQIHSGQPKDLDDNWYDQGPFELKDGDGPAFYRAPFPVIGGSRYSVRAQVKETHDDMDSTSALMRVDFFDSNGDLITRGVTGLNWSTTYGFWYRYLSIDTEQSPSPPYKSVWQDWEQVFTSPFDAVEMRVWLYRWTLDPLNSILIRRPRIALE